MSGQLAKTAQGTTAPTMVHRLRDLAADDGSTGITHVRPDGSEELQTYRQLWEEAHQALGGLRGAGARPGDPILLVLTPGREFLSTVWACFLGGMVPAVLTAPSNLEQDSEPNRKLTHVWRLLAEPLMVVPDAAARWFEASPDLPLASARRRTFTAVAEGTPATVEELPGPDDVALLQFSSGSTGTPKGVVLRHRNLVANLEDISQRMEMSGDDVMVTWLPDSHDMGMIGNHLMPLWAGSSQVKMAPMTFLRRPRVWLEKVTAHRGTVMAGPQFGVDYLLEKVLPGDTSGLDLSSLRLFANGAEPISAPALRELQRLAGPLGLSEEATFPVYGLAEATLAVTMPTVGELPRVLRLDRKAFAAGQVVTAGDGDGADVIEFVAVGRPLTSVEVRVVDESGAEVGERCVGHVQLRGASMTAGYFGDEESTSELFDGDWLRTGDLGLFDGDRLVITGRAKDVIFVKGENVYAHDIERRVTELSEFRPGEVAACGLTDPGTGRERVVLFVKTRGRPRYGQLVDLRHLLFTTMGFPIDHVLPVRSLPKTTSGKLQRQRLREDYLEGTFDAELAAWEAALADRQLARGPIDA